MRHIIKEFDPVIYPYKFWVIIHEDPKIIADYYETHNGEKILSIDETTRHLKAFSMMVQYEKDYGTLVYFRNKESMTYELVSHECSHAAKHLFEFIGADPSAHEPFEYVLGWMAGCCEKVKNEIKD